MKRVLLTGSDGFVGGHLAKDLAALRYEIHSTVFRRPPRSKNEYLIDVTRPETFGCLPVRAFDVIIHNVGIVDQKAPRELMYAVNADGTRNIVDWARNNGCKHFIQISSSGVYGLKTIGQNRSEDTRGILSKIGADYQLSKAKAERVVRESGLPYTILRLPPIIGKGDSVVSSVMIEHLKDGSFFRTGGRNRVVSILTIEHLPRMLELVIEHRPTNTEYNCPSHHVRWMDIVSEYARLLGAPIPETRRPLLSIIWDIGDKYHLFMASNSRFGSHLPNDKFIGEFGYEVSGSWKKAVRDAIED